MAAVGFLQTLWEKPIWEGVWFFLDPMDSVCLRTASMERNVPGKYGPHGELFFFLMQKEPAIVPDSETFSPFINPDIRTPFFSAPRLAHNGRRRKRWRQMGSPKSPRWESEGKAWSEDEGASTNASREGNVCMRCTSGCMGPMTRSLCFFSCRIWELAKVAQRCHMGLDMLCQEMREAWQMCSCDGSARQVFLS